MRTVLIIFAAAAVLVGLYILFRSLFGATNAFPAKIGKVTIKDQTYSAYVAQTPKEQEIGLSNAKALDKGKGMIFPFEKPGFYSFWMKNMKFPIDILFIKDKKIVTIFQNVPAPKNPNDPLPVYTPKEPADTVLELQANETKERGIKTGDTAEIKL